MDKVLTRAELASLLKISDTTLDKLRAAGNFVKPIKLGSQARWRASDVEAWIDQQITDEEAK